MEFLAALSIVCNVVQLIDASAAVTKAIRRIRKDGAIEDHADSQAQAQQLQAIISQLKKQGEDSAKLHNQNVTNLQIQRVSTNCEEIAHDLCAELESLKGHGTRTSAVIAGFRAFRHKDRVEKLQTKLKQHRDLLTTTLLVGLRREIQGQGLLQEEQFRLLDSDLQLVSHNSKAGLSKLEALIKSLGDDLFSSQQKASEDLEKKLVEVNLNTNLATSKRQLLDSLTFPEMFTRINQIAENEPGTFSWVFDSQSDEKYSDAQLGIRKWLRSDQKFFWVQGKAGSGKSTLMKFLWDNTRTTDYVEAAFSSKGCVVLKYSFWLAGTPAQRSVDSCCMSLLYQMLSQCHDTLLAVMNHQPRLEYKRQNSDWLRRELHDVLLWAVKATATTSSVAVFIDGLDEIAERQNYPQVLSLIKTLTAIASVKVCVSSRPESYWSRSFVHDSTVRLQDLVREDIIIYVKGCLADHDCATPFTSFESGMLEDKISHRAEGVFLWARLAMSQVLQALDGLASQQEVIELVNDLPVSIEGIYESMLAKQGAQSSQIRREAAVYFKAILSGTCLHLDDFAALKAKVDGLDFMDDQYSLQDLYRSCERLETRMPHICGGLIECKQQRQPQTSHDNHGTSLRGDPASMRVDFIHRTVMDFLVDTDSGRRLVDDCSVPDEDIVQCGIETPLKTAFLHKRRLELLHIVLVLEKIFAGRSQKFLRISAESIVRGIQMVVDALPRLEKNSSSKWNQPEKLADEPVLVSKHELEYQMFAQKPDRDIFWYDGTGPSPPISYLDITGCSLAHGVCDYAEYVISRPIQFVTQPDAKLTQTYKDYLLFCAILGCQRSRHCILFAIALIDDGADPFAELFLPVWEPRRVSAAAQLICVMASLDCPHTEDDNTAWKTLCVKIKEACPKTPVVRGFSVVVWPVGSDVALPAFPSSEHGWLWDIGFLVEADLDQLLHDLIILQSSRQRPNMQTFPLILRARRGPLFLAMFKLRSHVHGHKSVLADDAALVLLSDQHLSQVESEFGRLFESRNTKRSSYAAWKEFQEVLQPIYRSESTTKIDCLTWQRENGYIVDSSDPRLYRGPITRFEHIDAATDKLLGIADVEKSNLPGGKSNHVNNE